MVPVWPPWLELLALAAALSLSDWPLLEEDTLGRLDDEELLEDELGDGRLDEEELLEDELGDGRLDDEELLDDELGDGRLAELLELLLELDGIEGMGMLLEELLWELDWQATSPPIASTSSTRGRG